MMGELQSEADRIAAEIVENAASNYDFDLQCVLQEDISAALSRREDAVRAETWKEAIEAVKQVQEGFVRNGGRSARDREQQRRQSIYIRGLDDARGALEAAAGSKTKEVDEQKNLGR